MKKKFLLALAVLVLAAAAFALYRWAVGAPGYYGLPAVACVDSTRPLVQDFSFTLHLDINGQNVPLNPNIGHDPGKCLRVIYTDDASGTVRVRANDATAYTLADFFEVWHKRFSAADFMGHPLGGAHLLAIKVNGVNAAGGGETILKSGEDIVMSYR